MGKNRKKQEIFKHGIISIRGARVHNLKNIDVDLPRQKLVVITGLSGSGKSSLAFDTIYAEGQRRYVESLSSYARQFLGLKDKPDVDKIEGLSPTISIDQKSVSQNPRSTVGTITEIHDYLRLLFSRIGKPHCPNCGRPVAKQNVSQITKEILKIKSPKEPILIMASQVRGKKGERLSLFDEVAQAGFLRVRVDNEVLTIEEAKKTPLDKNKKHTIEVVIDRIVIDKDLERSRLAESVELALKIGDGILIVGVKGREDRLFSENYACVHCGINLPAIEPRNFSFNSPYGACPVCTGLGSRSEVEPDLVIPNKRLTLAEGAIRPWASASHRLGRQSWYFYQLEELAPKYNFSLNKPVSELPEKIVNLILRGDKNQGGNFEGVIPELERKWKETDSEWVRAEIDKYMVVKKCPACDGCRLRPETLAVTIFGSSIADWSTLPISEIRDLFFGFSKNSPDFVSNEVGATKSRILDFSVKSKRFGRNRDGKEKFSKNDFLIAETIIKEVLRRLDFMLDVGLDYLTLDRESTTLSGGEAQRIRLATQIGSGLTGVTYILDEPSIGLHERDQKRLLETLVKLRDMGNSVIVVEHDRQTIENADWVCDIGPGAGENGGHVIFEGTPEELKKSKILTGEYLSGRKEIIFLSSSEIPNLKSQIPNKPQNSKLQNHGHLLVRGATAHNLKNIDAKIPLGRMVAVTGVSGSGKSTLVNDILAKSLLKNFYNAKDEPGAHKKIEGIENIDKIVLVDQSPIGRTPRSNPATYTGAFTQIRDLFAKTHLARMRGYSSGRFSFNVKGGRCEVCEGQGVKKIEMYFLPDVYVECEECKGKRYNREALEVDYKSKTIADVLEMSVDEAVKFFGAIPGLKDKLKTLDEVGLGYMKVGQSAPSLSGGEAQRVKLATELSRRSTGQTLYILDEPTTGLHFDDIKKLLAVLKELVVKGNTVLIIEHNMDVIKNADWILDLGPEGGDRGGEIVACGTPKEVAKVEKSYTGKYLARII